MAFLCVAASAFEIAFACWIIFAFVGHFLSKRHTQISWRVLFLFIEIDLGVLAWKSMAPMTCVWCLWLKKTQYSPKTLINYLHKVVPHCLINFAAFNWVVPHLTIRFYFCWSDENSKRRTRKYRFGEIIMIMNFEIGIEPGIAQEMMICSRI